MNNVINIVALGATIITLSNNNPVHLSNQSYVNYTYNNLSHDECLQLSEGRQSCMAVLQEIEELENNWNENGAQAFSKEVISLCRECILNLNIMPEIFPVANGSVQFEYDKQDGSYLEFEISKTNIHVFITDQYGNSTHKDYEVTQSVFEYVAKEVELFIHGCAC